ncbi:MAG: DUF2085 domain-containing protein [Chloroflexi bacterium]|nr:DUF2085 domain-containing protein [Chloroflexota bacterium]
MSELAHGTDGISTRRRALDAHIVRAIEGYLRFFASNWLSVLNLINFAFAGLAAIIPVMMYLGLNWLAGPLFSAYSLVCHQLPYRSDFILGFQVAMCQRNVAIYASMGLAGLAFGLVRTRLRPLPWQAYLVLITPMAIDGFTQLFGLRESDWTLRTLTGGLFGASTVWLAYPHMEKAMRELRGTLASARSLGR